MNDSDDENKKNVIDCLNQMAEENSCSDEDIEEIRSRLIGLPAHYYIFKKTAKYLDTRGNRSVAFAVLQIMCGIDKVIH